MFQPGTVCRKTIERSNPESQQAGCDKYKAHTFKRIICFQQAPFHFVLFPLYVRNGTYRLASKRKQWKEENEPILVYFSVTYVFTHFFRHLFILADSLALLLLAFKCYALQEYYYKDRKHWFNAKIGLACLYPVSNRFSYFAGDFRSMNRGTFVVFAVRNDMPDGV